MSERMSQQELESYLWGAAVILRGLVDAGDLVWFSGIVAASAVAAVAGVQRGTR